MHGASSKAHRVMQPSLAPSGGCGISRNCVLAGGRDRLRNHGAAKLSGGNEALALLLQHAGDRRPSDRAHFDVRPGLGSAFQPCRHPGVWAARRDAVGDGGACTSSPTGRSRRRRRGRRTLMFELPVWQVSTTVRAGTGQWLAEAVATFGLLLTILGCLARHAGRGSLCGRPVHHRRVLVHRVNLLRQPRSDDRARAFRHFCRHSAHRYRRIHFDAAQWRSGGSRRGTLVLAPRFIEAR